MLNDVLRLKFGVVFALLTLLFGFGMGILFGAAEDKMKEGLAAKAEAVKVSVYENDVVAADKVVKKSWVYMKRAHLHANGLGTTSLGLIILLGACSSVKLSFRKITAVLSGLGGLGYSVYWLLAAQKAPSLGSTSLAKESLAWLALPSAMACMAGLILTLIIFLMAKASEA